MKFNLIRLFLFIILTIAFTLPAKAETRYVTDQLIVTLRNGKGTEFKILKSLKTYTPVEILEDGEDYVKARVKSGEVGYILKRYLTKETPKTYIIDNLKKEKANVEKKLQRLKDKQAELESVIEASSKNYTATVSELKHEVATLSSSLEQSRNELQSTQKEYETLLNNSKNIITLTAERDRLLAENKKITSEINVLRDKSEKVFQTAMIQWFLAGGGVFLFGWIIGKISRKKISRY